MCIGFQMLAPVYDARWMEQRADGARIDPAASGLSDYATTGERADASVRCTGLGVIGSSECGRGRPRFGQDAVLGNCVTINLIRLFRFENKAAHSL